MEIKVELPFQELLAVVKNLTPTQKAALRHELNNDTIAVNDKTSFIEMLLNGPVYTNKEIEIIEENRKSIAKWRTKS